MCGIAAGISFSSSIPISHVSRMIEAVKHRGPDGVKIAFLDEDTFLKTDILETNKYSSVLLGHSRLSIIDASEQSEQPMTTNRGQISIVFNGEIYNYLEIKKELYSLGYSFDSNGDTEVILKSYLEWGTNCLNKLRGMFAFVIIDLVSNSVFAVRDRFGIKPIYYWIFNDTMYFASEIKQFMVLPNWTSRINLDVAAEFLLYGITDHSNQTFFQDVNQILPGEFLHANIKDIKSIKKVKWYEPKKSEFSGSFLEAEVIFRDKFREAISLHLRSDVPIGSCLSGGLDSSAIVTTAPLCSNSGSLNYLTFTASSEDESIDETKFATVINGVTGSRGFFIEPKKENLWKNLDELIWFQEQPFGTTSVFAQWEVFKLASEKNVKVLLDGQGADEILGGYNAFISIYISQLIRKFALPKAFKSFLFYQRNNRITFQNLIEMYAYSTFPESIVENFGKLAKKDSQNTNSWISKDFLNSLNLQDPFKNSRKFPAKNFDEMRLDMITSTNLPMLLRYEDRNSMAFGIESRVPFLDHKLVEFALSLPVDFMLKDGETKKILTSSLRNELPDQILQRKDKIGFQAAEKKWLISDKDLVLHEIDKSISCMQGIVSSNYIKRANDILSEKAAYSSSIWRVLIMGKWIEKFNVVI